MREIKFRAWSEPLKLMQFFENDNGMLGKNGEIHRENYKIMQYTGLKDSNGKEIYEGDIVKGTNGLKGGPSEVFYGYGTWQPFSYLGNYDGNCFEVVGNIYENPELISGNVQ